jgi:hypothetical protein
MPGS